MSENTQDMINDKGLEALNTAVENKVNEEIVDPDNGQYEEIETHTSKNMMQVTSEYWKVLKQ